MKTGYIYKIIIYTEAIRSNFGSAKEKTVIQEYYCRFWGENNRPYRKGEMLKRVLIFWEGF
jgi:hypothetical protein